MGTSFQFLGFSFLVILAFHARRSAGWRQLVLIAANLFFLASFAEGWRSLLPIAGFLLLAYGGLRLIRWAPRTAFLPVLILTLGAFVWLKKYAFVPSSLLLPSVYVTVGLSYILFRVLHLFIDSSSGALQVPVNIVSYFSYTANFATLTSGPIQMYPEYMKTQEEAFQSSLRFAEANPALERIVKGLFKTNILALLFSTLHSRMLDSLAVSQPPAVKLTAGAMAVVYYPLFLFCNFSGYIDLVIGVGWLLGFRFPENFDRPFSSDNFLDFWTRRWHITLSAWLKTYVYNPMMLSLMRRFTSRKLEPVLAVFAFFVTFFLIGVWHGQTTEFLCYGFLLGLGVSVNKTYQLIMTGILGRKPFAALSSKTWYIALARGLTFTYFAVTLVWFWSTWRQIAEISTVLGAGMTIAVLGAIFAGATIVLALWDTVRNSAIRSGSDSDPILAGSWRAAWNTVQIVIILVITMFMNQAAPEIVYKAF